MTTPTDGVPERLIASPDGPLLKWLAADGARFTEPFFDDTLRRLKRLPGNSHARRTTTPVSVLTGAIAGVPITGLIFHISRCGSTLIARMLASLPRNIVIAEAPVIDDILQTCRGDPQTSEAERIAWLRGAVGYLTRQRHPEETRAFAKLDCWSIFHLSLIRRAFPGVPLLFVYRDPVEVLVSLMRRPSITLIRDTVTPEQLGVSIAERNSLSREEHAAAILGAFFREARLHRASLVPVAYQALPDFIWNRMPGCNFTREEQSLLQATSAFDAKNPDQRFASDTVGKHREASPAVLAASIRWTEPYYRRWLETIALPAQQ